jgi:hypothetical protein
MVVDLLQKNEALQRENECHKQQLKRFRD